MKILFLYLLLSLTFLFSIFSEKAFAKQVDLRHLQTPVKNQGNRDTCAYFAVNAMIESNFKKISGIEYDISEEFEIFRHKVLKPWRPEVEFGSTYDLVNNFIYGLTAYTEEALPYQNSSPNFTVPMTSTERELYDLTKKKISQIQYRGLKTRILSQMWVKRPWSQIFREELDAKNTVVVTLKLATPYINDAAGTVTYNSTIDKECSAGKLPCGGHAVVLVGYDDEQKVFMFKNSWGPKWGQEGYGFVTFDHVDQYSYDPVTAVFDRLLDPWVKVINP